VHVLGDATLSAPGMPKSGSMANQQAKVCAAAVVAMINGQEPSPDPRIVNTCYSFVSDDEVVHVASVHELDAGKKTFVPIKGAGGVSSARNTLEGKYAWAWAQNIWADMLG
jgi:sulfite dehydrogenase